MFSIIAVLLLCILAVVVILKKYKGRKTSSETDEVLEDPMDDISVIDVTEEVMMVNNEIKNQPLFYRYEIIGQN